MKIISVKQVVLKRVSSFKVEDNIVRNPSEAADLIRLFLHKKYDGEMPDRELFGVLYLNTKNAATDIEVISIGTLNAALVHPRETFKGAIVGNAASIIAFHNHPSNDCSPSPEDIALTKRLEEVGKIIGIELLDHVIVGEDNYCSFREQGQL